MKVVSVEATRMNYPRIKPVTVPRAGASRGEANRQATPLRRYIRNGASGGSLTMPPGNRDVGCVVTLEDGTWASDLLTTDGSRRR